MRLDKRQNRALKAIYKRFPHAHDPGDLVDFDCSTPSMAQTSKQHRLSTMERPLLINLHEIADGCFSESPEIKRTTSQALEEIIACGYAVKLPDLAAKRAKRGYNGEPLPPNTVVTVWLFQVTEKGIAHLTRRRRTAWRFTMWLVSTFVTAGWIALILKLLGYLNE